MLMVREILRSVVSQTVPVILICLGANLDVLAAAASRYELLKRGNPAFNFSCIALISTAVTGCSVLLGKTAGSFFPPEAAKSAAGAIFILLSLYAIGSAFRRRTPEQDSTPHKGSHTARVLLLGVMLSVNNIGLGIAAGVAGMQPGMLVCFTLIFTLLACYIGMLCAKKLRRYLSGRSLTLLSNLLLLAIGLYELLNGLIARGF